MSAEIIGIMKEAEQRYADGGGDYEPEHPQKKPRQHHPPIDQLIQVDAGKPAMQRLCHVCHVCHGTPSPPSTRPQAPTLKSMGSPSRIIARAGLKRPVCESWYWNLSLRVAQEQN